ncbi:MAG: hypothetical protein ACE5G1_00310 [bacterium]
MRNLPKTIANLTIAAALTFGLNACMEQSPLSSEETQSQEQNLGFTMLKVKNPSLKKEFQVSRWIDENGGTLLVGDKKHGVSELSIPANALSDKVLITFWWESTGFLEGGADFSPHGTQFNEPVRIELSYQDADLNGINEDDLKIYYYHEDTGIWEVIGDEVHKDKKTVVGYTTHFSRYAIGMD